MVYKLNLDKTVRMEKDYLCNVQREKGTQVQLGLSLDWKKEECHWNKS